MADSANSLRRSQRISQSNLQNPTSGISESGSCNENKQVANVNRPHSDTNHTMQSTSTESRSYALNKEKALKKKLDSCNNSHFKPVLKSMNNLRLYFSSAAFEVAKHKMSKTLNSDKFSESFMFVPKYIEDKEGTALVEIQYVVSDKLKNHLYTINCYNTTSSMLVNGSCIEKFIETILEPLAAELVKNVGTLNNISKQMEESLQQAMNKQLSSKCKSKKGVAGSHDKTSRSDLHSSRHYTHKKELTQPGHNAKPTQSGTLCNSTNRAVSSHNSDTAQPQNVTHQTYDSSGDLYVCPVCEQGFDADTGSISIACDSCNDWFHIECVGMTKEQVEKLDEDTPYICAVCNDELLYIHSDPPPFGEECTTPKSVEPHSPRAIAYDMANNSDQSKSVVETQVKELVPSTYQHETAIKRNLPTDSQVIENSFGSTCEKTPIPSNFSHPHCQSKKNLQITDSVKSNTIEKPQEKSSTSSISSSYPIENTGQSTHFAASPPPDIISDPVGSTKDQCPPTKQPRQKKKQDTEQRQYILNLEKQIQDQNKTISLLQKNLEKLQTTNDPSNQQQGHIPVTNQATHSYREPHHFDVENRLRQLEMQNMQNLCIFTALTSAMSLQQTNSRLYTGQPLQFGNPMPQFPVPQPVFVPMNHIVPQMYQATPSQSVYQSFPFQYPPPPPPPPPYPFGAVLNQPSQVQGVPTQTNHQVYQNQPNIQLQPMRQGQGHAVQATGAQTILANNRGVGSSATCNLGSRQSSALPPVTPVQPDPQSVLYSARVTQKADNTGVTNKVCPQEPVNADSGSMSSKQTNPPVDLSKPLATNQTTEKQGTSNVKGHTVYLSTQEGDGTCPDQRTPLESCDTSPDPNYKLKVHTTPHVEKAPGESPNHPVQDHNVQIDNSQNHFLPQAGLTKVPPDLLNQNKPYVKTL